MKHGFVLDQPDSESEFFKIQIFSKALRNFSKRRMAMFNILEGSSNIVSLRSKHNQSHTTRQTDYMAGNVTKVWILKNSLSESGW